MNSILWKKPPTTLLISRSKLHVWRIDLNNLNYPLKTLCAFLSSEETDRSRSFIFRQDRHRYQVTHGMKRLILAYYLACDPHWLRFKIGNHGKPKLSKVQNSLKLQFNLSHSKDLILMAVTVEDSVGIDIEYQCKKLSIDYLSKVIF